MKRLIITLIIFALSISYQFSLNAQDTRDQITIGDDGVMRWTKDNSEVTGFGTNYTVPFAYAYRNGKKMGVDLKAAIDQDVYQFARLGFDLYRVHVWDTEISDTLGNLLQNEHLDLFDYLLAQLKKHHINAIITPIAYWGNGWPEKDEDTPGFSHKYGKANCLVNPDAIKAQVNYIHQFVNHVNPYLGKAYKDESMILAFEVCNEPHHDGTPAEVTTFVKKMKDAIRQTGCTKPVFYNVSHKIHLADAYFAAGIDGGTFQWYPTGLGFQKELGGNMLPNVDRYPIPFDDVLKKNHAARFVYEFDAADLAKNYLYPAMARSFRTAGIQLATQFAWDPTFTAPYNTEYNTHFMNLLYAPQKALSLMICGEIFRNIPLYSDYGVYPDNTRFGPFHVSYEDNLAEMVSDKKFIYTNNTISHPPSPEKLELIAGWGNSPMIEYEGTGAYFLDKVGDQIWRLEIMPDAVQVNNLFGRNNLNQVVAVIKQERRKMKFNLPGFEDGFSIESVDWHDSIIYRETKDKTVALKPGVYLLMGWKYINNDSLLLGAKKPIDLENFLTLPAGPDSTYIYPIATPSNWTLEKDHKVRVVVVSPEHPYKVILKFSNYDNHVFNGYHNLEMKEVSPYTYECTVEGKIFKLPKIVYSYHFEVVEGSKHTFFPNLPATDNIPISDDVNDLWILQHSSSHKFILHTMDFDRINKQWLPSFLDVASFIQKDGPIEGRRMNIHIHLDSLGLKDNENQNSPGVADYTFRHFFADKFDQTKDELLKTTKIGIEAWTTSGTSLPVQVSLVMKDGRAFGNTIIIDRDSTSHYLSLAALKPVPAVLMPRPYPTFLPYYSAVQSGGRFDMSQVESVEFSIGPGIKREDWKKPVDVFVKSVWLE